MKPGLEDFEFASGKIGTLIRKEQGTSAENRGGKNGNRANDGDGGQGVVEADANEEGDGFVGTATHAIQQSSSKPVHKEDTGEIKDEAKYGEDN